MAQTVKLTRGSAEYSFLTTNAVYEDETGATFSLSYVSQSLANGYAWASAQNVDLSPFAGTEGTYTPYTIVFTDENGKKAWGYIGAADAGITIAGELLSNTGFETAGGGGADVFANWTESAGDGAIVDNLANPQAGTHSALLTAGASANTYVKQAASVDAGRVYRVVIYADETTATKPGRYRLYDATNSAWITSLNTIENPIGDGAYYAHTRYFTAPAGCSSVELYLYCPADSGRSVDYDSISIKPVTHAAATAVHIVSQKGGSVRNWAYIQSGFSYNSTAYTFDVLTTGFTLLDPGWIPSVTPLTDEGGTVEEVLEIEACCFSQDNVAAELAYLTKLLASSSRFVRDRTEHTPVWLQEQLSEESSARRALVYSGALQNVTEYHGTGSDSSGQMLAYCPRFRLALRRGVWERTSATTAITAASVSSVGGTFDYSTTDVAGTLPARLYELLFTTSATPAQVWAGFRSQNKHPDVASFVAVWEAESAADGTDVADVVDATGSGGNIGHCSFATTTTWAMRYQFRLGSFISDEADGYGTFLVLARLKNEAAGTNQVRLVKTLRYSSVYAYNKIVDVTANTAWNIYDLGTVTFPLEDRRAFTTDIAVANADSENCIELWAREVSGAVDLDIDCLILIPIDEFFIHANMSPAANGLLSIVTGPLGNTVGTYGPSTRTNPIYDIPDVDVVGPGVPLGDGRCYIVVARSVAASVLTDTADMSLQTVPRWHMLRGNE